MLIDEARFPGRQGRLLFAYLVAEQGRAVPRDELAEALWGEAPPATWDKALTVLASKLRALLADTGLDGANALTAAFGCYRLQLPDESWVDVIAAANAAQEAEDALAADDLEHATAAGELAASLSRQPFLPGEDGAWVEAKRRELAEVQTRALAVLVDAALRSGDGQEAAKWAKQTIALEPFRETGYRRLMEAHAAAGNRAEALRVYDRCRRLLADELGTYPSPETESVYRELLEAPAETRAVPAPDRREPTSLPARRARSRRRSIAAGVTVALAAALLGAILATEGGGTHVAVAANSIVGLDSSGSIAADISVGARPVAIAAGEGSLWVANLDDQSVTRVDVASGQAVRNIPIGGPATALATTRDRVWATDGRGDLSEIDPAYDRIVSTRSLVASTPFFPGSVRPTVAGFGSIWVVDPDGYVTRVDPDSGRKTGSVDVGNDPSAIAAGAGSIWVTNRADGTVTRIDPGTLVTTSIPVGHGPAAVAVNAAGAWVATAEDNKLARIDTGTNAVAGTTRVGDGPTAVLATPSALWVANAGDGTVMRLDPSSGKVRRTIRLAGTPDALAAAAGRVWVAIAPAPPRPAVAGGVARVTMQDDFTTLDPASSVLPLVPYATCANLVTYPDKPAPAGSRIVPEVAETIPVPMDGGRTYTFKIRPGFRFSPPSNEPVTAATFKSTIERVANSRTKSIYGNLLSGIVGYRAYVSGRARGLAGVVTRGRTLTIRLSKPDGGFLATLAAGAACAVPRGTPADLGANDYVPAAGPYYVSSYTPRQQLVLRRNPNYHGNRPHHFDQIVFAIGVGGTRAVAEVESGKDDYALDLPRDAQPRLESQYGPGSKAAEAGHQQYFISAANGMFFLHMNASRPLFSHLRLRRAVNYAIDRPALVAQGHRFSEVGPFNPGVATDDYLPPSVDGAEDFHVYPVNGPDLGRAKRLAGRLHATAIMYTPNVPPWLQETQIVKRNLKPLGIDVEVKEFSVFDYFRRIGLPNEPFDLALAGWWLLNTDPAQALDIFDSSAPDQIGASVSHFNDPEFNRALEAAAKLSGTKRDRASSRIALKLERDEAPAAAVATAASRDFFSARIGCQIFQPVFGIDLAALCLRE